MLGCTAHCTCVDTCWVVKRAAALGLFFWYCCCIKNQRFVSGYGSSQLAWKNYCVTFPCSLVRTKSLKSHSGPYGGTDCRFFCSQLESGQSCWTIDSRHGAGVSHDMPIHLTAYRLVQIILLVTVCGEAWWSWTFMQDLILCTEFATFWGAQVLTLRVTSFTNVNITFRSSDDTIPLHGVMLQCQQITVTNLCM